MDRRDAQGATRRCFRLQIRRIGCVFRETADGTAKRHCVFYREFDLQGPGEPLQGEVDEAVGYAPGLVVSYLNNLYVQLVAAG